VPRSPSPFAPHAAECPSCLLLSPRTSDCFSGHWSVRFCFSHPRGNRPKDSSAKKEPTVRTALTVATRSRPSSSPFSQEGLRLDTGRDSSPSRVDRAVVTTSIIREYGVRRNAVEIIFWLSDGPRHSMDIINLCNVLYPGSSPSSQRMRHPRFDINQNCSYPCTGEPDVQNEQNVNVGCPSSGWQGAPGFR